MECENIQKIIPDYIRNVASQEEIQRIEEHLCLCHKCREFLGQRVEDPAYSTREHVQTIIKEKKKISFLDYIVIAVGLLFTLLFIVMSFK